MRSSLAGSPARNVSCFLVKDGLPIERAITTQASLENGVLFSLNYTNGVDADQEKFFGMTEAIVTGDSGVLLCVDGQLISDGARAEIISNGKRQLITSAEKTGGTTGMFIDLISSGCENPASPEEYAWAVSLTEASYCSAEEKRVIVLD